MPVTTATAKTAIQPSDRRHGWHSRYIRDKARDAIHQPVDRRLQPIRALSNRRGIAAGDLVCAAPDRETVSQGNRSSPEAEFQTPA